MKQTAKQLLENKLRKMVKEVLKEKKSALKEGSKDVVDFERWAGMKAKAANMDVEEYINRLLHDLSFAYEMPKSR